MTSFRPAVIGLALLAGACSPGQMIDRVPDSLGGLPAGAPARPTTPYQYPAVHDMPPARATQPMNETDQVKLEKDLQKLRDRQAAQAGAEGAPAPPAAKSAPPPKPQTAKKKPADVIVVPPAGATGRP